MSQLEKLKSLFQELGIGYTIEQEEQKTIIRLESKVHEKVVGYNGFASLYEFDKDGVFIEVGIWE